MCSSKVARASDGCKKRASCGHVSALHEDARVRRGMERQLAARAQALDAGARSIGWKLGLGTAAAMAQHRTSAPVVGYLTDRGLLDSGTTVAIGGWAKPAAEPEIAVHVARDVPPGADPAAVAAAIGGLGVALELVDLGGGGELEDILAGDIFHRHVVLGPPSGGIAADELRGAIVLGGEPQYVGEPLALVGDPAAALGHLATHLAAFGETVRAGEVLITGSIVPALTVTPGQRLEYRLEPLGELALEFVA
jgi:2-keto-4-pentenoate hydratase